MADDPNWSLQELREVISKQQELLCLMLCVLAIDRLLPVVMAVRPPLAIWALPLVVVSTPARLVSTKCGSDSSGKVPAPKAPLPLIASFCAFRILAIQRRLMGTIILPIQLRKIRRNSRHFISTVLISVFGAD
jgi:hypothetical protein